MSLPMVTNNNEPVQSAPVMGDEET